jgi:hypothetical protein
MPQIDAALSTGLLHLDRILSGLIPGDNIVWQVAGARDYEPFVRPYCENALARTKRLTYFRFADHPPLVQAGPGIDICQLDPRAGFEQFVSRIHGRIAANGDGGYYLFDILSTLAVDWYSDQMLANFFRLTCPYLYDVKAIAYFGLLQGFHSSDGVGPISETAQVLIDVYRHRDQLYIHPTKVQQRYTPTMYMLHVRDGDAFRPVVQSATISEIMTSSPAWGVDAASKCRGVATRAVLEAEAALATPFIGEEESVPTTHLLRRLLRMTISRDERVLELVEKYFSLEDVLAVMRRMVGTGLVGGKSVGMLLARAILQKDDSSWRTRLEPHDSFYIGSDVYYTFVVSNGLWWVRERQKDPETFLEGAESARHRMLVGTFAEPVVKRFGEMLDYFGQSPIIVRSSSLLEDNFGNAFAGKYESVFCANQGPRERRLQDFMAAVREIYASTMSRDALSYRAKRGLLERDEQMPLLVQRVSGGMYRDMFFPHIAGVGLSYNPYVWNEEIDPEAGMMRMVCGLGTRAVDRCDDDYTRVVALNAPERRPESTSDDVRRYSQRRVDVLDLIGNQLVSHEFEDVVRRGGDLPLEVLASRDEELERRMRDAGRRDVFTWVLTFQRLLRDTEFVDDMRQMLSTLQKVYEHPVDIEFTANMSSDSKHRINLVQCRPLQVKGTGGAVSIPEVAPEDLVLEAKGAVIGQGRIVKIDRLVYVVPSVYGHMPINERHSVARLIGAISRLQDREHSLMLVGPGRWGTTTPSLGIPVKFGEISTVSVVCELVEMKGDVVPEVSLGTHFFNELVEMDVLYVALFPNRADNYLNRELLESFPNRLAELVPGQAQLADAVRVIDFSQTGESPALSVNANAVGQKVVCYLER